MMNLDTLRIYTVNVTGGLSIVDINASYSLSFRARMVLWPVATSVAVQ